MNTTKMCLIPLLYMKNNLDSVFLSIVKIPVWDEFICVSQLQSTNGQLDRNPL